MPADLTINSLSKQRSLLIEPESLVILQREGTRDRVRRIRFDRVESVVVWKSVAWVAAVFTSLLPLIVAVILISIGTSENEPGVSATGAGFLALAIILAAAVLMRGKTHIRIRRAGVNRDFACIKSQKKLRIFLDKLANAIDAAQESALTQALERGEEAAPGLLLIPEEQPSEQRDTP